MEDGARRGAVSRTEVVHQPSDAEHALHLIAAQLRGLRTLPAGLGAPFGVDELQAGALLQHCSASRVCDTCDKEGSLMPPAKGCICILRSYCV